MKQGDIYLAKLQPVEGQEQGGVRPVVIISGDSMNAEMSLCVCCPLTSQIKEFPTCPVINPSKSNGLELQSQVLTFQIRTLSKKRFVRRLGSIDQGILRKVVTGLIDTLQY